MEYSITKLNHTSQHCQAHKQRNKKVKNCYAQRRLKKQTILLQEGSHKRPVGKN